MENLNQFRPKVNSQRWLDISDLPNEVWLDIQGYEGVYQISCYGRIKSLPRTKRRDLLFIKMKEAGYEWDKDEKVLNKVIIYEQK